MNDQTPALQAPRFYFVDEAGDAALFNEKGRVLVGTPGCSRFRSTALRLALQTARGRFELKWKREVKSTVVVSQAAAAREPALQAADYFLWALQRHYELAESRFVQLIWPQVGVVQAIDETHVAPYGSYYTKKKPLVV